MIDGVIAKESIDEESFDNGLLEYPQYTEPYNYDGKEVPDILYSGNHEAIKKWRKKDAIKLTKKYREDLYNSYNFSKQVKKLLQEIDVGVTPQREEDALIKGHKFIKK